MTYFFCSLRLCLYEDLCLCPCLCLFLCLNLSVYIFFFFCFRVPQLNTLRSTLRGWRFTCMTLFYPATRASTLRSSGGYVCVCWEGCVTYVNVLASALSFCF